MRSHGRGGGGSSNRGDSCSSGHGCWRGCHQMRLSLCVAEFNLSACLILSVIHDINASNQASWYRVVQKFGCWGLFRRTAGNMPG
jgi:hypothetical protein